MLDNRHSNLAVLSHAVINQVVFEVEEREDLVPFDEEWEAQRAAQVTFSEMEVVEEGEGKGEGEEEDDEEEDEDDNDEEDDDDDDEDDDEVCIILSFCDATAIFAFACCAVWATAFHVDDFASLLLIFLMSQYQCV